MVHSERKKRPEPYPADVETDKSSDKDNIAKCTSFLPFVTSF